MFTSENEDPATCNHWNTKATSEVSMGKHPICILSKFQSDTFIALIL
jgi:hypothetical protein